MLASRRKNPIGSRVLYADDVSGHYSLLAESLERASMDIKSEERCKKEVIMIRDILVDFFVDSRKKFKGLQDSEISLADVNLFVRVWMTQHGLAP